MKWRALVLPVLMAVSLGAIYVLPKAGEVAQSAVVMKLPAKMGGWQLNEVAPSEAELNTLSSDTEFSKAYCVKGRRGEYNAEGYQIPDRVDLSIVLSGTDLNNSIHRPERCMPAQGHQILESKSVVLDVGNGHQLKVRRLKSVQTITRDKEKLEQPCLTYYFFIGSHQITNDHFERTLIDMKDRLLKGEDQRWAYVSVSMWYGKVPWMLKDLSEEEANDRLVDYLKALAGQQIQWEKL